MKVLLCFVMCCATLISAKVYTRCDLARELLNQGFPKEQLKQWICLIEAESERNMAAKDGPFKDQSYSWGIFAINDYFWCTPEIKGGDCRVKCEDLLTDIRKAARCAKLIHKYYGFSLWSKYNEKCMDTLPRLADCGIRY